jgi:hypothetical protein
MLSMEHSSWSTVHGTSKSSESPDQSVRGGPFDSAYVAFGNHSLTRDGFSAWAFLFCVLVVSEFGGFGVVGFG